MQSSYYSSQGSIVCLTNCNENIIIIISTAEPFDLVVLSRSLPNCLFCGLASQAAHKMTASKAVLAILLDRLTKSSPFTLQQQQPNYGCLKSWLKIFKPPAPLPKSLQQCVAESNLFSPRKQPQPSLCRHCDQIILQRDSLRLSSCVLSCSPTGF